MFSKKIFLPFAICLSLAVVGCGKYLGGEKNKEEVIDLPNPELEKLKKLPEITKEISVGEASESDVRDIFETLQYALSYFQKRTRGSAENGYSVEDMRKFFGKYFLKENNVSPELAQEAMKLKKALLGGSEKWLTKEEISQVIDLLGTLKEETVLLTPHMKILLMKTDQKTDWNQVSAATDQLRRSFQRLLKETQLSKSDYTFADAKSLLTGLSQFLSGDKVFSAYSNLESWAPVIEAVKVVLIGESARFTGLGDWSLGLDNVVDLYDTFLKYHYVLTKEPSEATAKAKAEVENKTEAKERRKKREMIEIKTKQDLRSYSQFFAQGLRLVTSSFQMQKQGQIPFAAIDGLLEQAVAKELLPETLTAETLKKTYRILVLRGLDSDRKGDVRALRALTRDHMQVVRREFNIWRLSQNFIDQLEISEAGLSMAQVAKLYDRYDFDAVIRGGLERDPFEQESLRRSWKDFGQLIKGSSLVNFDSSGRVLIVPGGPDYATSWISLMRFNLMSTVTRLFMIAYGDHGAADVSKSVLRETDLTQWYTDFQDIGQELQAFDPRSANPGRRSFMEANFFTYAGDGNDIMSYNETFEFVSFLFSAGLGSGAQIQKDLQACEVDEIDVMRFHKFDEKCFRQTVFKNFAQEFANLPKLVKEIKGSGPGTGMNEDKWNAYIQSMLAATRVSDAKSSRVEMSDLRTLVMVMHYIESLMRTYDTDGSQTFSVDEIARSFPRFASFLRSTNPGVSDANLNDGFAYMLFYGQKPTTMDIVWYKAQKLVYNFQANRVGIAKVFKVLKDDLNKAKK